MVPDGLLLRCNRCRGTGRSPSRAAQPPAEPGAPATVTLGLCPDCKGRGKILTRSGKAIIELIQYAVNTGQITLPVRWRDTREDRSPK